MPRILDYSRFLTTTSKLRQPSPIRMLFPLMTVPGMISLGGGLPNASLFPLEKMTLTLKDGTNLPLEGDRIKEALQYSPTPGLPHLVKWLMNLQLSVHKPIFDHSSIDMLVGTGSQDLLGLAFSMLIERGDHVIVEKPTYSGSLSALVPMGCKLHGVFTDQNGMIPESLEDLLNHWPSSTPKPKVLYIIPNGCNPSGGSLSVDRRKAIYKLAQKHDLLILEDDAYYYLQFTRPAPPSLFSMDEDGRVIRFDSVSKIISSGLRLGFATGPKPLIERMQLHAQATYLHTSGVSQAILYSILEHWGLNGFLQHTDRVSRFYETKRDLFATSLEKHLKGLAEWNSPSAGMFFWIKLLGIENSEDLIMKKAVQNKVLLVPGSAFMPDSSTTSYVRASFSIATEEQVDEALKRLANLVREEQKTTSSKL